jgi:F-type H+-transporting ATPase subunit epsilon
MSGTLALSVLTPVGKIVEAATSEVILPGHEGELTILPSHTTFLSLLGSGRLTWMESGKRQAVAIKGGLVEVESDRVVVLTEEAMTPDDHSPEWFASAAAEARRRLDAALELGEPTDGLRENLAFLEALLAT